MCRAFYSSIKRKGTLQEKYVVHIVLYYEYGRHTDKTHTDHNSKIYTYIHIYIPRSLSDVKKTRDYIHIYLSNYSGIHTKRIKEHMYDDNIIKNVHLILLYPIHKNVI